MKMPLKDEKAAACQQKLIRDRQANDAEDQEREDRGIAIGRDPMKDSCFQLEG